MPILDFSAMQFEKFLFILLRVSGIMVIAPLFGHRNIPNVIKIGFAGLLTLVLLPVVPAPQIEISASLGSIFSVAVKEVVMGLILGFSASVLFMGVQMAGHIMGFQMGFMVAQVIDPSSGQQVSLLGQFQFILALLIFLAVDGHHLIINAVAGSFNIVPIGEMSLGGVPTDMIMRICVDIFAIAIKIGAPMVITLFLTDVALGIIARTVPQMNVFIVGFPLKIAGGFMAMAVSFPFISYVFTKLMHGMDRNLTELMVALSGRL